MDVLCALDYHFTMMMLLLVDFTITTKPSGILGREALRNGKNCTPKKILHSWFVTQTFDVGRLYQISAGRST